MATPSLRPEPYWESESEEEVAKGATSAGRKLYDAQASRRERALANLRLFEGRQLADLTAGAYADHMGDTPGSTERNLVRSACNAVHNKIAGADDPIPQLMTVGGDWQVQRRAKKLTRYSEAQFRRKQSELHPDVWAVLKDQALNAIIQGLGVGKVTADAETGDVTVEVVHQHNLYWDPIETESGPPRAIYERVLWTKEALAAAYPDIAHDIWSSTLSRPDEYTTRSSAFDMSSDLVEVWEVHIAGVGKESGVRIVATGSLLLEEEDEEEWPYLWLFWSRNRLGMLGTGLVEEARPQHVAHNELLTAAIEGWRMSGNTVHYYREGSISEEAAADNSHGVYVPVKSGAEFPVTVTPETFSASHSQLLKMLYNAVYEDTGVGVMGATSRKEAGVTSGKALRTLADQQSERFQLFQQAYEALVQTCCRKMISATRRAAKNNPDLAVKWRGKRFMRSIKWADAVLEEDQYEVDVLRIASGARSMAGRLEDVQALVQQGWIPQQLGKRLLNWPDLEAYSSRDDAQWDFIEDYIDRALDATPEQIANGEFVPETPEPFYNLELCVYQVAQAYIESKLELSPEVNLSLLRQFIELAVNELEAKAARVAALQQQAGGAPAQQAAQLPGMAA